jgi:hypothetical protein
MIILAIDPGISGALAFYNSADASCIEVLDMPILNGDVNPHAMWSFILDRHPDVAIIEQVSPMPKEGVSSVWRFASAFTTAHVVVRLMNIPVVMVPPAKWKRSMNLKGGKEGKEQARKRAIEAFPSCAQNFHLKKHHGRAEAAMLAVYAATLPTIRNNL